MLTVRPAETRGASRFDWLDSRHSFSFADYYDPAHMGFRSLRVINDDRIAPGAGFPDHPHRDMEIVTYMLDGAIEHRDSLGNGSVISAGEVQRMSAGTGIVHSEFNHSAEQPARLLQIWILPSRKGLAPGYQQVPISPDSLAGTLRPVASPDGREGSLIIHQDIVIHAGLLAGGDQVTHQIAPERHVWLQVARGTATVNGKQVGEGDGIAVSDEQQVKLAANDTTEMLLFDMA